MTSSISIEPFDGGDFTDYLDRIECYFCANDIGVVAASASSTVKLAAARKMTATFITLIGKDTYAILKDLCYPDQPMQCKYEDLVTKLKTHFSPTANVAAETYRFNQCNQMETESVKTFANRLKRLAATCEFGDHLNRALRDQFVRGLKSRSLTKKLLMENKSFAEALKMAITEELAEANAAALTSAPASASSTSPLSVNAVQASRPRPTQPGSANRGGNQSRSSRPFTRKCSGCGGAWHQSRRQCPAWGTTCKSCSRLHHYDTVCRSKGVNLVDDTPVPEDASSNEQSHYMYDETLYHSTATDRKAPMTSSRIDPYLCTVRVGKSPLVMEVDTGASVTIVSEQAYRQLCTRETLPLETHDLPKLRTYASKIIPVVGRFRATVSHGKNQEEVAMYVVQGQGPNLLGRDCLNKLKLDWNFVFNITGSTHPQFCEEFPELFKPGLGTWKHGSVRLAIDRTVKPRFLKARSVPYAMQDKVDAEIDRLVKDGIMEPIEFVDWAAPIVPVLKSNGQVRICGDYKCTINQAAKVDKYPLPNIEDLYVKLTKGACFTKLDLSQAYQQLPLDSESKLLTAINTPKGLFVYNRLPYGVSSAPGIFQRTMEKLLAGIPMVAVYLNDILISGRTREEHDQNVRTVLSRLEAAGLRLNRDKCSWAKASVVFLGHVIDTTGIKPCQDKVQALVNAPAPTNISELRSYLGMVNYYHKFLCNLSSILAPLYELLSAKEWHWIDKHQTAFTKSKAMLMDSPVRMHYNPDLPIVVNCDASPVGVGAVLSHFAVKSFHKYLYGRTFSLLTDHKPLLGLFQEDHTIPPMASGRIQRWALTLANYQYQLQFKSGKDNGNADGLSRLPVPIADSVIPQPAEVVLALSVLDSTPVTAAKIARWSRSDPVLSLVIKFVESGWPESAPDDLIMYSRRRLDLTVTNGCLLLGARVVIPSAGRDQLLDELHEGHPGISRMKALARSYIWWPTMDQEIDLKVRGCPQCQAVLKSAPSQTLHPWEWPGKPWVRLHIDYAGPVDGKMLLVIVDSHSKYIDVHATTSATSQVTIDKLRQTFATHGLPLSIVSDNGPAFASEEFRTFCNNNDIKHTLVSPYHPASNGLAERAVQTVKTGIKKQSGRTLEQRLYRFLFQYRITPHSTTGESPAQLLMNRRLRSRLDLTFPDTSKRVLDRQSASVDRHAKPDDVLQFHCGDSVQVLNFSASPKWMSAVLEERLGPVTFMARLTDGRLWKRHLDHIRHRLPEEGPVAELHINKPLSNTKCTDVQSQQVPVAASTAVSTATPVAADMNDMPSNMDSMMLRRSTRTVKPPQRLDP